MDPRSAPWPLIRATRGASRGWCAHSKTADTNSKSLKHRSPYFLFAGAELLQDAALGRVRRTGDVAIAPVDHPKSGFDSSVNARSICRRHGTCPRIPEKSCQATRMGFGT